MPQGGSVGTGATNTTQRIGSRSDFVRIASTISIRVRVQHMCGLLGVEKPVAAEDAR